MNQEDNNIITDYDVLTYKEALQECLGINEKLIIINDEEINVKLSTLGLLIWQDEKYTFCPIKYNGEFISPK
jgi:hypothetical protein